MQNDAISKFVSECAALKPDVHVKALEVGPTLWLLGSPAQAPEGMVGLATTLTQRVCFRREDILEVRESAGQFLVKIATGTNVLVREEAVMKLNPASCGCRDNETTSAARVRGSRPQGTGSVVLDCSRRCWWETECVPHKDAHTGAVILVCQLTWNCDMDPCGGGTTV